MKTRHLLVPVLPSTPQPKRQTRNVKPLNMTPTNAQLKTENHRLRHLVGILRREIKRLKSIQKDSA